MTTALLTAEQMFHDFLVSNGHPLETVIDYDSSKFHYFKCPHGNSTDARYKFYSDGIPSGYFICWHCGVDDKFCSKQKHELSKQEWENHTQRLADAKNKNEIETKERHAEVAILARSIFSAASENDAACHGYLQIKKVKNHGLRVITVEDESTKLAKCYKGTLLAPCFNANNELVNLERIYFNKQTEEYQKRPLVGGQRNDAYYLIGDHTKEHNTILLVEGTATGFTAYEATGYRVAITYNCHNLLNVAKILRKKYPHTKLLIISDDDKWHKEIYLRDAGVKAAKKVCATIEDVSYVLPNFEALDLSEKQLSKLEPTDINDLFVHLVSSGVNENDALAIIRKIF